MNKSLLQGKLKRGVKVFPGLINRLTKYAIFSFDLIPSYWKRAKYVYSDGDFVRNSTLELISREIYANHIDGAVAELGVFRGDFAKLINQAFPDRKLYLFDTFEGFNASDVKIESDYGVDEKKDDFSTTSVDYVLNKMKYKNNCSVRKGYFPETFENIDEKFCYVSIDCDLYKPTYDGLCRFWLHMNSGGYIMVHDYQNTNYPNTKLAVTKFCKENNVFGVPVSDINGSIIIVKP